ncbi:cytochrome P450 [Thelephora terrestris]|uniref:Cytochrome P450 n=1 Tax=Thelephora terrestris TaxID=56493 RepID=A0A9P6HHJ2_9AGAM|nr:cytochrome P450 [Thelephora terrestris]
MSLSEKFVGPVLAVIATGVILALARRKWASIRLPYPPGPKGYPIIGNVLNFPENPIWEGLTKMAQEYNTDTLHLNLLGSHLVVLSNSDLAPGLAERDSVKYSDRPQMGMSWALAGMPYGKTWRVHRKVFHRFFNVAVVGQYDDKICKAVNVFLHRLSESPDRFLEHAHFLAGSLNLSVAYGLDVESESDKFYSASNGAINDLSAALIPGAFLVDVLPILKYVPEWFPGAGFKKFGKTAKENIEKAVNLPFQYVKNAFQADDITTSSFVASCLEDLPELSKDGVDEETIRSLGGTIYLDTRSASKTSSFLQSFFLAATLHPEVVCLAQRELDEVVGGERLPELSDIPQLPYISAFVKEVLRWGPPVPLSGAHRVMEDDVYKGRFIPAGTAILDNVWAMFRNESDYPDPLTFNPGRFLKDGQIDPNVKDPELQVFGWGRRICPGRHFALRVSFLAVARTLATFDISKCIDEDGNPIVPDRKYTFGAVCHPLPFRSDIKPRSTHALSLIAG